MKTLKSFLKAKEETFVRKLTEKVFDEMEKVKIADTILVVMIVALVAAFKGLGLAEEVRLLGISVLCYFGSKGMGVPVEIAKLFEFALVPPSQLDQQVAPPVSLPASEVNKKSASVPEPAKPPFKRVPVPAPVVPQPTEAGTVPARTLNGVFHSGDFAGKLGAVAGKFNLGPLPKFRQLMTEEGNGKDYWDACRKVTDEVLSNKLLVEPDDWQSLVGKMKERLFFNCGPTGRAFLNQCPKEILTDLLIGEGDNLWKWVEAVNVKPKKDIDASVPFKLEFILEACKVVGKEVKRLSIDTKHVANRLFQIGVISKNHQLIRRIEEMKSALPASKFAEPNGIPVTEGGAEMPPPAEVQAEAQALVN